MCQHPSETGQSRCSQCYSSSRTRRAPVQVAEQGCTTSHLALPSSLMRRQLSGFVRLSLFVY